MKTYKLEDIFGFAVEVEEQGQRFYEAASADAKTDEEKDLFAYLSKAETKHAKRFLKFQASYARKGGAVTADAHFSALLDTLMRGMIFPDRAKLREAIGQRDRNPLLSLIRIAMEVEANSVMFYQEMSSLLAEAEAKEALAKIVKEEQGHLIKLKQRRLEVDPYYAALKYGSWF